MIHSNGVAFRPIVDVFLMKMVWKKFEVMIYYQIFLLLTQLFIAADCWKPKISCCIKENISVMEKTMLTSWQLIHIEKEKNWVCIEQLEDDIGISRKNLYGVSQYNF